ncbi:MAG: hypothetical protein ACYDC5_09080 [Candidatus Dormibacteria bacterium]
MTVAALLGTFNFAAIREWPAYQSLVTHSPVVGSALEVLGADGSPGSTVGDGQPATVDETLPDLRHPVVVVGEYADALGVVIVIRVRAGLQPFALGPDSPTIVSEPDLATLGRLVVFPAEQALIFPALHRHAP